MTKGILLLIFTLALQAKAEVSTNTAAPAATSTGAATKSEKMRLITELEMKCSYQQLAAFDKVPAGEPKTALGFVFSLEKESASAKGASASTAAKIYGVDIYALSAEGVRLKQVGHADIKSDETLHWVSTDTSPFAFSLQLSRKMTGVTAKLKASATLEGLETFLGEAYENLQLQCWSRE